MSESFLWRFLFDQGEKKRKHTRHQGDRDDWHLCNQTSSRNEPQHRPPHRDSHTYLHLLGTHETNTQHTQSSTRTWLAVNNTLTDFRTPGRTPNHLCKSQEASQKGCASTPISYTQQSGFCISLSVFIFKFQFPFPFKFSCNAVGRTRNPSITNEGAAASAAAAAATAAATATTTQQTVKKQQCYHSKT